MEKMQPGGILVPSGGGKTRTVFGIHVEVLLTGEETGGAYATYQVTAQPGEGPLPHLHRFDDEAFYVLEGEFEVLCGDTATTATAGSFVFLPRNVPHAFKNVGTGTGSLLGIATPAGHEHFFEDINRLAEAGPLDFAEAVAVSRKHGIEVIPPPGT